MFLKYIPYTTYTVYISLYHNMEENHTFSVFCIFHINFASSSFFTNLSLNIDIDIYIGFAYFFPLDGTSYHALLLAAMCCGWKLCGIEVE